MKHPEKELNLAEQITRAGFKPFLEYSSYVLYNYRLQDPSAGIQFSNVRLVRAFEHGLHTGSSEEGFVSVHLNMVKHSGALVKGVLTAFTALETLDSDRIEKRTLLNEGLACILEAMTELNTVMKSMFAKSRPAHYNNFRTFMFGITSQTMFPTGVIYEGLNNNEPMFFRGETGANDSMVPLMDNFLQISMPDNPLTDILKEFRQYRPQSHKEFVLLAGQRSLELDVKNFTLGLGWVVQNDEEHALIRESRCLWLFILNQIREFRWRHWGLTKEYIIKRSKHPTATGGSPIVNWLPSQIEAFLNEMTVIYSQATGDDCGDLGKSMSRVMEVVASQAIALKSEVEQLAVE